MPLRPHILLPLLMGLAAPLAGQASDPTCLFLDAHLGRDAYTGGAFPSTAEGSVVDRCSTLPTHAWEPLLGYTLPDGEVSGSGDYARNGTIGDLVGFTDVRQGFSLWTGAPTSLFFQFFLDGAAVHSTGWFRTNADVRGGEIWGGRYDQVLVRGAYVVMLSQQPELPAWEEPEIISELALLEQTLLVEDDPSVVPEPATLTLLGTGLVGLAGAARRRKLTQ